MLHSSDAVVAPPARTLRLTASYPVLGGAFIAAQSLALNAVGLFATAYIICTLGPLQYGQWATAAALISTHLLITSAGLRTIFVREVARRPERARELLAVQLALRIVLAAVAAACAMAVATLLGYPAVVIGCTAVGCVSMLFSVVSTTFADLLQSLEKFGSYSATALLSGIAVTASSVAAVALGCGPVGLSLAYLTAPVVNAVFSWCSVRKHVDVSLSWDSARAWALLREARLLALGQIAAAVRDRIESLVVPGLIGLEAFGIFSAGAMIGDRLVNVPDAICTAFYPRLSRSAQITAGAAVERTVARMLTVGLAASLPFAILATYLAGTMSAILLPDARDMCRAIIQVSVWSVPLTALSLGMSFALQAVGGHEYVARRGLRTTAVSAAVSCALVATGGIAGASCALVARPAAAIIGLLPAFRRTFPGAFAAIPFGRMFLAATVLTSICVAGEGERPWIGLVCATLGGAAYALALVASRVFSIAPVMAIVTRADRPAAIQLEP